MHIEAERGREQKERQVSVLLRGLPVPSPLTVKTETWSDAQQSVSPPPGSKMFCFGVGRRPSHK